jgi:hypothetical protein
MFIAIIWVSHLTRLIGGPFGLVWINFIHLFLVSLLSLHHGVDGADETGADTGGGLRVPFRLHRRGL